MYLEITPMDWWTDNLIWDKPIFNFSKSPLILNTWFRQSLCKSIHIILTLGILSFQSQLHCQCGMSAIPPTDSVNSQMKAVPFEFLAEGPALSGFSARPAWLRCPAGPSCRRRCRWSGCWRSELRPPWHQWHSCPASGYLDRLKRSERVRRRACGKK